MGMTRREFVKAAGLGACAVGVSLNSAAAEEKVAREAGANINRKPMSLRNSRICIWARPLNPEEGLHHLHWMLNEVAGMAPRPALILATADMVCAGTARELEVYAKGDRGLGIPIYSLPSNHDLWGEKDTKAFERLVGPVQQCVKSDGLTFLLWNDIQRLSDGSGKWRAMLTPANREWLKAGLTENLDQPTVVVQHSPPQLCNNTYHDVWRDSNGDELLDLLAKNNVLALITGHWHRNGEWLTRGMRVINTGPLCGWQYNGVPPYSGFPVRPGYRLLYWDGQLLRSFWRDGSYWKTPAPAQQVTITQIDTAHAGGAAAAGAADHDISAGHAEGCGLQHARRDQRG